MKLQHLTERGKGILAIISLAIIYGIIPLILRYFSAFDLFQQIYMRLFIGFIFTVALFYKRISFKKIYRLPLRDKSWIFVRTLFYYGIGAPLYVQAVLITKISDVVFIDSLPMVSILGFILLREKVTWKKVFFVCISFLGVFIISLQGNSGKITFGFGELLTLISTIFVALGLISRKWLKNSLNDYETTAFMLFFATIQIFIISLFAGVSFAANGFSLGIIIALLASGVLLSILTFFLNYGFARVDAVLSGNILSLSSVVATILALFFYKEVPTVRELFGGFLILLSAFLLDRVERKKT